MRHGHTSGGRYTRIYIVWKNMRRRCFNPRAKDYINYGGRGIIVCARWRVFTNFLSDMGEPPTGWTIERIDNNGNYEPGNCRWATHAEQSRNNSQTNMLTFRGETLCVLDWAKKTGIPRRCIHDRLSKLHWTIEDALTKPLQIHVRTK